MNILVLAVTPFEFYLATSILLIIRKKYPEATADIILAEQLLSFIKPSPKLLSVYQNRFQASLPGLTPSTRKFISNWKRGAAIKRFITSLPLASYSHCLVNSYNEFCVNILYRHLDKRTKLFIVTPFTSTEEHFETRRKPMLNFSLRLLDLFFGFAVTDHRWSLLTGRSAFRRITKYPPHTKIFIADHDAELKEIHKKAPGCITAQTAFPPFSVLKEIFNTTLAVGKPIIFVAGERTPPYPGWTERDEQKLALFFDYLRDEFPDHELHFKPRPKLTDIEKLRPYLSKFIIIDEHEPLEEYFPQHNVKKVISFKSTVSRTGIYYSIPSYVIYPLFDMPTAERTATADILFQDLANIICVTQLSDLKKVRSLPTSHDDLARQYEAIF